MRSFLPVVLVVLCCPAPPAWAQGEPSEADPAMREKGVTLKQQDYSFSYCKIAADFMETEWAP